MACSISDAKEENIIKSKVVFQTTLNEKYQEKV